MDEERLNRELDEILDTALLNDRLGELKDITAIRMAVLHGYYDMSDALEFIRAMYEKDGDSDD